MDISVEVVGVGSTDIEVGRMKVSTSIKELLRSWIVPAVALAEERDGTWVGDQGLGSKMSSSSTRPFG